MSDSLGALSGIKVLDLTDERGIYGVKLLADLGADVVRPEPVLSLIHISEPTRPY